MRGFLKEIIFELNIKNELTWLRQSEKHSRKKEWHVLKLGGSRVNPKDSKFPSVTTGDSEGGGDRRLGWRG